MKKSILIILTVMCFVSFAEAQCIKVFPGTVFVNRAASFLSGRNFNVAMSCAGRVPGILSWRGGNMCVGRTFYGRTFYGSSFSCRVRAVRVW